MEFSLITAEKSLYTARTCFRNAPLQPMCNLTHHDRVIDTAKQISEASLDCNLTFGVFILSKRL